MAGSFARAHARALAFALGWALAGGLPFEARAGVADLENVAGEVVHASVVVPEPSRKVGEVRLLARGEAVVVQTLLSTRLLERVIAEIRVKERRNWPEGDEAVARYLGALENARHRLEQSRPRADWSRERSRLLIEFAADEDDDAVFVGSWDFAGDGRTVRDREVFEVLTPRRDYVLRNIRLILADSFGVPVDDVDRLGPLGPAALAPSRPAATGAAGPAPPEASEPAEPAGKTGADAPPPAAAVPAGAGR